MTSQQRFERDLPVLLADLYVGGIPDYRDELVQTTAATRQRPAWTFPTRWLPMDITMRRVPAMPAVWRVIVVALLLVALIAAAVYVGSQRHVAPPFGPARNGAIAYSSGGELYVRDSVDSPARLVAGGPGDDAFPTFSPDGTHLLFSTTLNGDETLKVANADGSSPIKVFEEPIVNASAAWAPDGRSIALITTRLGFPTLFLVSSDGTRSTPIDLGLLVPMDIAWRPPLGETLLVRASGPRGVDLYTVRRDGTGLQALGLPSPRLFGEQWDLGGPAWSTDGGTIAYNVVERNPSTGVVRFRVHLVNADGSHDRSVIGPKSDDVQEAWPQFSPDGSQLLVHRWTWSRDSGGSDDGLGWLAVLPADGGVIGRDIGPRIKGGEHTGLTKSWSPDGSRVLMRADNTQQVYSIDPVSGEVSLLDWAGFDLPDIERLAP